MSRHTNYESVVLSYLKQVNLVLGELSSNSSSGATEQTALDILAALGDVNNNLVLINTTNTLLSEIRDEAVAQTALLTTTDTLLTDILAELIDVDDSIESNGLTIADIRVDLSNIQSTLDNIDVRDSNFYPTVQSSLSSIQGLISAADAARSVESTDLINRINLLNGYTLDIQNLLSDIDTTLQGNGAVNVTKLEELRVLLSSLDSNTDAIESELINIISEQDQTQAAIASLQTAVNNASLNRQTEASLLQSLVITSNNNLASLINQNTTRESQLNDLISELQQIESLLVGVLRTPSLVEVITDGSTQSGVQSFNILFDGDGGTFNGISVPTGFKASYTVEKDRDTLDSISFTVPTSGSQRVLIGYVI